MRRCADAVEAAPTAVSSAHHVSASSIEFKPQVLLAETDQDTVIADRELTLFTRLTALAREGVTASIAAKTQRDPEVLAPVYAATIIWAATLFFARWAAGDTNAPVTEEPLGARERAAKLIATGCTSTSLRGGGTVGPTAPWITDLSLNGARFAWDTAFSLHATPIADSPTGDR